MTDSVRLCLEELRPGDAQVLDRVCGVLGLRGRRQDQAGAFLSNVFPPLAPHETKFCPEVAPH